MKAAHDKLTVVTSRRLLIAALLMIFVCSWLASVIQTAGGAVVVSSMNIPTHNGQ
jgi:hypothetical protein